MDCSSASQDPTTTRVAQGALLTSRCTGRVRTRSKSDGGGQSVEEVEVEASRLPGVDHQVVAAVELQDDELKQVTGAVEPDTELPLRAGLVEVTHEDRSLRGEGRVVGTTPCLSADAWTLTRHKHGWPLTSPPTG